MKLKFKQTHFSTSIEGNLLSYNQVKKVVSLKPNKNQEKNEQEVLNYWDALTFLEKERDNNTPITKEFIFNLHDIIAKKGNQKHFDFRLPTPPGVLFAVYDSVSKTADYIPPESADIDQLIDYLIDWYNNSEQLPPPIRAAIMHYGFASIHPFDDGNGRTSRALANYILMLHDYDLSGFNSFEEYYMSDLDGYYKALQMNLPPLYYDGRENPPHLEIWIEYFCKIMAVNAESVYELAKETSHKQIKTLDLNKKDFTLIRYCIEKQIFILEPKDIVELFGVSLRSVSLWLKKWCERGILIPNRPNKRIISYSLNEKYTNLKLSDIGFSDE